MRLLELNYEVLGGLSKRVAGKPKMFFTTRKKARCWPHLELSKKTKKKKLKILEIAGPKSF